MPHFVCHIWLIPCGVFKILKLVVCIRLDMLGRVIHDKVDLHRVDDSFALENELNGDDLDPIIKD